MDILSKVSAARGLFSETDKCVYVYLTIPVTTYTAERHFSVLHWVKLYLRFTMTEECLNNVVLLHIHKDRSDQLDLMEVANLFVSANLRCVDFLESLSDNVLLAT